MPTIRREQVAALAGLTPFVHQSGKLLTYANTVVARGTRWTRPHAAA